MPSFVSHPAWKLGIIALGSLAFASCGTQATNPAALEANELLDMLDGRKQGMELEKYAEVDIGSFRMTLAPHGEERALRVSFRLVAIVPESQKASFETEMPKYEKRIRDAAIALVGRTDHEQLAEPSLEYLKGEMVAEINRILQKRLVRDAAFSSFSLGHNWPKEDAAPAKPKAKSSGHH
ncbi:MAG: flagellar basal body-associated FliL family protein [Pirellulaceae bacterium]